MWSWLTQCVTQFSKIKRFLFLEPFHWRFFWIIDLISHLLSFSFFQLSMSILPFLFIIFNSWAAVWEFLAVMVFYSMMIWQWLGLVLAREIVIYSTNSWFLSVFWVTKMHRKTWGCKWRKHELLTILLFGEFVVTVC
jgi:hypothetical protein